MKNFIKITLICIFFVSSSAMSEVSFNNASIKDYKNASSLKGDIREIQKATKGMWPRMRDGGEYKVKFKNDVQIKETEKYLIIKTNNIPDHKLYRNNPNCAKKQSYTFKIPKKIKFYEKKPKKITKSMQEIGVTINGIVIAGPYDSKNKIAPYNRQVGPCAAHTDPEGMYHYHFAPLCLLNSNGKKIALDPNEQVGWSFDGIKIMGLADRYKHKPTIDESNGHNHGGEYHYHATIDFPFFMGSYKAKPISSNFQQKKRGPGMKGSKGSASCPRSISYNKKGKMGRPDFKHASKILGISTRKIKKALGPPPPDFENASKELNVSIEKLKKALHPKK